MKNGRYMIQICLTQETETKEHLLQQKHPMDASFPGDILKSLY